MSKQHKDFEIIGGVKYYSVTTITGLIRKVGLEQWRGDLGNAMANLKMQEAGDFGNDFHALALEINAGRYALINKKKLQPVMLKKVEWYKNWFFENVEEVLHCEEEMTHPKHLYKGKPDLIAKLKGIPMYAVIDFKTGKTVYPDTRYQLSAYKEMAMAHAGIKIRDRIILHMPREAEKNTAVYYDNNTHLADFNGFLLLKEFYKNYVNL